MPHIHWAGILRSEPAEYQKGALRGDAKKLAMPASMRELTIKALPFAAVPLALIFFSVFLKTFLAGEAVLSPAFFALGFLAGFAGLSCPRMAACGRIPRADRRHHRVLSQGVCRGRAGILSA